MVELKYAVVERERRWLLGAAPASLDGEVLRIEDRYLTGTRLRLREVTAADGTVVRKLGHKIRLDQGPEEVAHTSLYLDEEEWAVLQRLPGRTLTKRRTRWRTGAAVVAVDEYDGHLAGLVLVEVDAGDGPAAGLPDGFEPTAEVTGDERYTGGALAWAEGPPPPPAG